MERAKKLISLAILNLFLAHFPGTLRAEKPSTKALEEPSVTGKDRNHWAFRRPVKPQLPQVLDTTRVRTPIDAFVLSKLEQAGLKAGSPADRATLIRRLTFDLTGLPPTPLELENFLKDDRPDAYEKVVERLLASSHYGERWARHWMDIVHFAETHGHDQDRPREYAWPYRDYLIRAFNEDRPYPRFLREQV